MVTGGGLPMRVLSRECRKISYEALAETSKLRSYLKATLWVYGGQSMIGVKVCPGQIVLGGPKYVWAIFENPLFKSTLPQYAKLLNAFWLDSQCTGEPNTFIIRIR